jgi:hypothetical protein
MDKLFGRKPTVPIEPTDRVLPLHFFESSLLVQRHNMAVSLLYEDVLDPEKLRTSLESLVKREGWQRLGGRLRKNATTGSLEWHIPTQFTTTRPAIEYAHVEHNMPASAHPAASTIREPSSRPMVVGDPDLLADLVWGEGSRPKGGISDYLSVDKPVLSLRVNSFTDKTLVTFQWQHVAFDALGMQYLIENWAHMLHGRDSAIPTPCGTETDPFNVIATGARQATEEHVLMDRRVGLGGILKWGLGYGVDVLLREKENRIVCIPETYWKPQYERALQELRAEALEQGEDPSKVFLTENDILTAWIIRCVVNSMDMDPKRTVAGSIAMSLRKAFEGDLLPPSSEQPYVGNAFGWANVLVTAGDVTSKPLSWLARQVRRAINEQGTRAQHEAYYHMVRTQRTGLPIVIFGNGDMAQIGVSNWSKVGLFHLDLGPARKIPSDEPCLPSYVQENHGPIKAPDGFVILGKDCKGNYWTDTFKVKGQWAKFQEQLDRDFETGR